MYGIISQQSKYFLQAIENDSARLLNGSGGNGGSSVSVVTTPSLPTFDFDLSKINEAVRRGNTEADIRSAYEVFTTGTSRGRGLGYAQDIQRRFSPGLISTYGSSDIRTAAANYLDSAGLPRLASFISPTPTPAPTPITNPIDEGDFFGLPPPPNSVVTPGVTGKNPFEILADVLPKLFGNAVYNPPLQSQAYGYTPTATEQPLAQSSGGFGIGTFILLGVVGVVGYFLYKRFAS